MLEKLNLFRKQKPIFTGDFASFSPFDRKALQSLICSIDKPFKNIAEIGSWIGKGSSSVIIEEIRHGRGVLYCIDHWQGNPNVQRHQNLVAKYDIFNTFRANISLSRGTEVVKPLVMSSRDAASIIKDGFFDLVFIDGDHSYDETIIDIDLWLPKVAIGGILCGHDCEARPETFDKASLLECRNRDFIKGNDSFLIVHPGVILAVDEKFTGKAHLWAEETVMLENGTRGRSTIWDIYVNKPQK